MGKKILASMTEELIGRIGKESAETAINQIKRKGISNHELQNQLRKTLDAFDNGADISSSIVKNRSPFPMDGDGQLYMREVGKIAKPAPKVAPEATAAVDDMIPGQMHIDDLPKRTGPKEAKGTKQGDDGQMYLEGAFPDDSPKPKNAAKDTSAAKDPEVKVDDSQVPGQEEMLVNDHTKDIKTTSQVRDMRQAEVDKANRTLPKKVIDSTADGWKSVQAGIAGTGDAGKKISGRKTREVERQAMHSKYVETGEGAAKTKKQFYQEHAKPTKPYEPVPEDYHSLYEQVAEKNSKKGLLDSIPGWAKGIGLVTAGGIAGGIAGNTIFDTDDE